MRMLMILLLTALFGMLLTMATAPSEPATTTTGHVLIPEGAHVLIPGVPGAVTLEDHNAIMHSVGIMTEAETNIKCPKCGDLVWKDLTCVMTSYPAQYHIRCKKCGWGGTCY